MVEWRLQVGTIKRGYNDDVGGAGVTGIYHLTSVCAPVARHTLIIRHHSAATCTAVYICARALVCASKQAVN